MFLLCVEEYSPVSSHKQTLYPSPAHDHPPFSLVHPAVIAINDAIDHGVPEGTITAMQNPNAMLVQLDQGSAQHYQDMLYQAKGEKVANSRKRVGHLTPSECTCSRQ